jgi:hypothetical protein
MLTAGAEKTKKGWKLLAGSCLVAGLCLVDSARAAQQPMTSTVSGEAEVSYVQYDAEEGGVKKLSANSLAQRYSLLYHLAGTARDERFGKYNLQLGYRWASINTKVSSDKDENISLQSGNVLYRGEILFDPPSLPLRLKIHSEDIANSTVTTDGIAAISAGNLLIAPNMATDMAIAGTNINSGFTLLFGEKAGLANNYAQVFSLFPLMLVDYRDTIQKNTSGQVKIDRRTRQLALSSLNKGDNWVHYRSTQYDDYIDTVDGYTESQLQIGLVDNLQRRKWVDLTNWIKISA